MRSERDDQRRSAAFDHPLERIEQSVEACSAVLADDSAREKPSARNESADKADSLTDENECGQRSVARRVISKLASSRETSALERAWDQVGVIAVDPSV